jgi:hypothetical protein
LTESYRGICAALYLEHIQWAAKLVPGEGLLRFYKNADIDGFVADLSAHTMVTQEVYQLKVSTMPGGGLFEVSMKYDVTDGSFTVRVRQVSFVIITFLLFSVFLDITLHSCMIRDYVSYEGVWCYSADDLMCFHILINSVDHSPS